MIPKSDDVISGFFQNSGASEIIRHPLGVLSAVDFNYELEVERDEVNDVSAQRMLPFEFGTCKLTVAQPTPNQFLSVGHSASQALHMSLTDAFRHAPSPYPLPKGERVSPRPPFAVANLVPIAY